MRTLRYNVSYENMISRLPALFAYIEEDEKGIVTLHHATDAENGCYGKVVENVLYKGNPISYRTLMEKYYAMKREEIEEDEHLISFVDEAIGKVEVTGVDFDKCDLCPTFVYLANVRNLYNKYYYLHRKCGFYETLKEKGDKDVNMCCLCNKFKRMGGEEMMNFLVKKIDEAEKIAEDYYNLAVTDEDDKLTLNFNVNLINTHNDLGLVSLYVEEWVPGKVYYPGDKVYYNYVIWICIAKNSGWFDRKTKKILFPDVSVTQDYTEGVVFVSEDGIQTYEVSDEDNIKIDVKKIEGTCDSKLKGLRRSKPYLDPITQVELTPDTGKDWLFYYRIGQVISYDSVNDENGNIGHYGNVMENGNDLLAYGDVIINIERNEDEKTITFTYGLDVHLTANYDSQDIDEDGIARYYFKDFQYDNSPNYQTSGVIYTETFNYVEDDDIDRMSDADFNGYIRGGCDTGATTDNITKYEFICSDNARSYKRRIGYQDVEIVVNEASFEFYVDTHKDMENVLLFRNEYYNGISYKPTKEIDVHIQRGITAAFEHHTVLSQVYSFEDLENFQNGGYFKIQES